MTASNLAKVVAEMRNGAYQQHPDPDLMAMVSPIVDYATTVGPTVDATNIYQSIQDTFDAGNSIALYEDHPCVAPAFQGASIGWVNAHDNVNVLAFTAVDRRDPDAFLDQWETAEPVDWGTIRWTLGAYLFIGGRSKSAGRSIPTAGPVYAWWLAVNEDGRPEDIRWIAINERYPSESADFAQLVLMGSLNFLACRNVELVEPTRQRSERRRIERVGVRVTEINVRPMGRSYKSQRGEGSSLVPLTSVRGHFAEYGETYGKGKLFGKHEGRYWIPHHARGSVDQGETDQTYILNPEPGDQQETSTT